MFKITYPDKTMYEIEAKIKKNTINTFVKLIAKLPHINLQNIEFLACELFSLIEEEVDKSKEENDLFI